MSYCLRCLLERFASCYLLICKMIIFVVGGFVHILADAMLNLYGCKMIERNYSVIQYFIYVSQSCLFLS